MDQRVFLNHMLNTFIDADEQSLGRPISMEEIEGIMNSSDKDKSLGPDGWGVELFIHFKELMGHNILVAVEES